MNRDFVLAGAAAGIGFGALQSFSLGPIAGASNGLFVGIGTTALLWKFATAKSTRELLQLSDEVLLPDERVLQSWLANLVIEPKDFGLQGLASNGLLWTVGMKNRESLGGAMHLTNYRIVFKTHRYNRLRGVTSVFLPNIRQLDNHTVWILSKLTVETASGRVAFAVADVDKVISQIRTARDRLDEGEIASLRRNVACHPEKCNSGMQTGEFLNRLSDMTNLGRKAASTVGAFANPLAAVGAVFLSEFLEQPLIDRWQRLYDSLEQQNAARARRNSAA